MKRIFTISAVVLTLASCAREVVGTDAGPIGGKDCFTVSIQDMGSKLYLDNNVEFKWNAGDCISVFGSKVNDKYSFDGQDGDNVGTYSITGGSSAPSFSHYYSVFPYSASNTCAEEGKIGIEIPAVQSYDKGLFTSNIMVAVTSSINDKDLKFRNVCGYVRLSLYSHLQPTISKLKLKGNNGENLAGAALVSASAEGMPSVTLIGEGKEIVLDCGAQGVRIGADAESATDFYVMVPPVEFTSGITMSFEDATGGTFEKSTSKSFSVGRNDIQPLAALGVEPAIMNINGTDILYGNNFCGLITNKSTGEPLPGIVVTDCFHCTVTDENGVYQMAPDPRSFCVAYSMPNGFKTVLDETTHLPKFWANDVKVKEVNRRDFALEPVGTVSDEFSIAMIGDVHIGHNAIPVATEGARFKSTLLNDIQNHFDAGIKSGKYSSKVFAMTVGDLANDNGLDEWTEYYKQVQGLRRPGGDYIPFYQCIGNHDHRPDGSEIFSARKNFSSYFGPVNYSFDVGRTHIIVIDDAPASTYTTLNPITLNWVKEDLSYVQDKEHKLVMLVAHVPFRGGGTYDSSKSVNGNRKELYDMLSEFHQAHVFTGHTHRSQEWINDEFTTKGGYPIYEHIHAMSGGHYWERRISPDGSPFAYSVYTIKGDEIVDFQLKPVDFSEDVQMRVYNGNQSASCKQGLNYWYKPDNLVDVSNNYYAVGNPVLKDAFVVTVWKSDTENWDFEFWQDGLKKGNLIRVPSDICDVFTGSFFYSGNGGNYDCIRKDTQHYFYYPAPGGNPASVQNWEIRAIHHVPSSQNISHTYTCSTLTTTYDGFIW